MGIHAIIRKIKLENLSLSMRRQENIVQDLYHIVESENLHRSRLISEVRDLNVRVFIKHGPLSGAGKAPLSSRGGKFWT